MGARLVDVGGAAPGLRSYDAVAVEIVDLKVRIEQATRVGDVIDVRLLGAQVVRADVRPKLLQRFEVEFRGVVLVASAYRIRGLSTVNWTTDSATAADARRAWNR